MIAFGPIPSRRLGQSLGVNNIPPKACSYNCAYCQVGPTPRTQVRRQRFYPPEQIAEEVSRRVQKLRRHGEEIDYLSFVPDGEPTLDVHLGQEIELLRPLDIPIAVFTNGSLLDLEDVRLDLALADLVSVKVDAVLESTWRKLNRPYAGLQLETMLRGQQAFAAEFQGVLITETMLVEGINDGEADLAATARFIARLAPRTAYIAIPNRPTAEAWSRPASEEAVTRAYELFRARLPSVECLTGFESAPFGCTGDVRKDLLATTAVHPMRESEVDKLLAKAGADRSVLADLMAHNQLKLIEHGGDRFYVRPFGVTREAPAPVEHP